MQWIYIIWNLPTVAYQQDDSIEVHCDCSEACDQTYYTTSLSSTEYPSDLVMETVVPLLNVTEAYLKYDAYNYSVLVLPIWFSIDWVQC